MPQLCKAFMTAMAVFSLILVSACATTDSGSAPRRGNTSVPVGIPASDAGREDFNADVNDMHSM
jgi:hypothetical protein